MGLVGIAEQVAFGTDDDFQGDIYLAQTLQIILGDDAEQQLCRQVMLFLIRRWRGRRR